MRMNRGKRCKGRSIDPSATSAASTLSSSSCFCVRHPLQTLSLPLSPLAIILPLPAAKRVKLKARTKAVRETRGVLCIIQDSLARRVAAPNSDIHITPKEGSCGII